MDYKERYEQALKRAKAAIDIAADKDLVKGVATTIFPELRESEDERIRKIIIKHFEEIANRNEQSWINLDIPYILAYLERRKEATCFAELMNKLTATEQEVMFNAWPKEEKEQKPAEWSEEDERIRKAILGFLNPDKGGTKYSSNAELVEWSDWFKSLSPSWKPSEEDIKMLEHIIGQYETWNKNSKVMGYLPRVEELSFLKKVLSKWKN